MLYFCRTFVVSLIVTFSVASYLAQVATPAKVALGSNTAKNGFKNENEIRDKFNNWRNDKEAQSWLVAMNYDVSAIEAVTATKPHGEKADVELLVRTKLETKREGISIKLVSSPTGFNQIDKRWLSAYAKLWKMPENVVAALKLFVGETPPIRAGRDIKRMYLNELDDASRKAVIDFFASRKGEIVFDLFSGDGTHSANWIMVALKATDKPRWVIRSSADAVNFFANGRVEITKAGNLKIGRVTMQRKGGDGGRETAKMLQFKINPVQLFDAQ